MAKGTPHRWTHQGTLRGLGEKEVVWSLQRSWVEGYQHEGQADKLEKLKGSGNSDLIRMKARWWGGGVGEEYPVEQL